MRRGGANAPGRVLASLDERSRRRRRRALAGFRARGGRARRQATVKTSQPIYNAQGLKLLEGGVTIDQTLYDKLVSHRLSLPLDECIDPGPGVEAASLEAAARAAIARWPFFARVAPEGAAGKALLDAVASVRLAKPVALHLTLARETRPALFDHSILMALLLRPPRSRERRRQGRRSRGRGRRPAARPGHAPHRPRPARFGRAAERRRAAPGVRPSDDVVDARRSLPRVLEGDRSRHRRAPRAARRLGLSARPRRRRAQPARPRPRPRRGRHRDVRRHAPAARAPRLAAAADQSAPLRRGPRRQHPPPPRRPRRGERRRGHRRRALDRAPAPAHRRARALARVERDARRTASTARRPRCVVSVDAQNATLQRMLYDAGVTREQLGSIAGEVETDAALRIELWAIAEELLWQLHAAANQLKRRWPAPSRRAVSGRAHGVVRRRRRPRLDDAPRPAAEAIRRSRAPPRRP